jgi:hypothetical protein
MAGSHRWPGSNVVALRFSDRQLRALELLARKARVPLATLLRKIVLDTLRPVERVDDVTPAGDPTTRRGREVVSR